MRIGTWNLAGRWSDDHAELMTETRCDVWLLTEVSERTTLPGYELHLSEATCTPKRRWAGIASRQSMEPLPDPHAASAAARIGGTTFVSSVLPWRSCGSNPWVGVNHAAKTENAVNELLDNLRDVGPLFWGGDWNHALTGKEYAGSQGGRRSVMQALDTLGLTAATVDLPHALDGLLSIDHVAVPRGMAVAASRIVAEHEGRRLSDHDAYVIDAVDVATPA